MRIRLRLLQFKIRLKWFFKWVAWLPKYWRFRLLSGYRLLSYHKMNCLLEQCTLAAGEH